MKKKKHYRQAVKRLKIIKKEITPQQTKKIKLKSKVKFYCIFKKTTNKYLLAFLIKKKPKQKT